MVTLEQVKIYTKYNGNGDLFVRNALKEEQILSYNDWRLIDEFVQDLVFVKKELVSNKFKQNIYLRLKANCDNEATVLELEKVVFDGLLK